MCPGSYPLKRFVFWAHLNDVVKMKDSKGNKISIGDRVKVLWNFDNKIYAGDVLRVNENVAEIKIFTGNISMRDHTKITKIPDTKKPLKL
jgi:uncharacterized Zn ribbon protein